MKIDGTTEYKCRRCGSLFEGLSCTDIFTALTEICKQGETKTILFGTIKSQQLHLFCPDGSIGIGDLVGAKSK